MENFRKLEKDLFERERGCVLISGLRVLPVPYRRPYSWLEVKAQYWIDRKTAQRHYVVEAICPEWNGMASRVFIDNGGKRNPVTKDVQSNNK